jgi:hypothetical protein
MASILKVDTLTGVTTAGSISVTGEGNSTTTNLQQGLAKAWSNLNGSTFGLRDSFNVSSATDNGTGSYAVSFVNNMDSANYSIVATAGHGGVYGSYNSVHGGAADITSSQYEVFSFITQTAGKYDVDTVTKQVDGDLA